MSAKQFTDTEYLVAVQTSAVNTINNGTPNAGITTGFNVTPRPLSSSNIQQMVIVPALKRKKRSLTPIRLSNNHLTIGNLFPSCIPRFATKSSDLLLTLRSFTTLSSLKICGVRLMIAPGRKKPRLLVGTSAARNVISLASHSPRLSN